MRPVSIAFIDQQPIFLHGLVNVFSNLANYSVVTTGHRLSELNQVIEHQPDIVLLDVTIRGDVFAAIRHCMAHLPKLSIVILTASEVVDHAVQALAAGAVGYVLKKSTAEDLTQAISIVLAGGTFITPSFASDVIAELQRSSFRKIKGQAVALSVREDQIVRMLLEARTNKEIAAALNISEKTVKHYMSALMQKLQVRNRMEVANAARNLGTFSPAKDGEQQRRPLPN